MNKKQLYEYDSYTDTYVEQSDELPLVKNWLNAHLFPKYSEENDGMSLTIPDQSLTVAEMLARQSKGLPISFNSGTPYYLGEEEMPDIQRMDLSEIQDLREFIYEKKQKAQEQALAIRERKDQQIKAELEEFRRQKAERQASENAQKAQSQTQYNNEPKSE